MNLFKAFFLGILQGATEFLPVSSSGHLVLVPWLLGWASPGLAFDAVVHWGTALAVVAYFWRDWVALVRAALCSLRALTLQRFRAAPPAQEECLHNGPLSDPRVAAEPLQRSQSSGDARLAWLILLGTVPAALIGWLLEDFFEHMFDRPAAAAVVGFGCIHFLLRYLQRHRLYPFAIYCAIAGVACLVVAMLRGG